MDLSRGGVLLSVNLAARTLPTPHDTGRTGIGKHPVTWPVPVSDPGPKRRGHPRPNGLAGDIACTTEHHGGTDQAVYAAALRQTAGLVRARFPASQGRHEGAPRRRGESVNVAVTVVLGVSHQDHAVAAGDLDAVAALAT